LVRTSLPISRRGKERLYLFKRSLGAEQVVDHINGHADERRHPDAVAQGGGPWRVLVVEQLDLWWEGQKTDDDELHTGGGGNKSSGQREQRSGCVNRVHGPHQQEAGADGHPADPPEVPRVEAEHEVDVVTETVGTCNTHTHTHTHTHYTGPHSQ